MMSIALGLVSGLVNQYDDSRARAIRGKIQSNTSSLHDKVATSIHLYSVGIETSW